MSHKRYQFLTILLALVIFAASGNTQPPEHNFVPPVAIGPQNLSFGDDGVHEFLTQEGTLKGDIGGIVAGQEYWVYIWGIDASGVSGLPGRRVRFHLQDSENGSSFKHLGISLSLQNSQAGGADLLECYQGIGSTVDGTSTHALGIGSTSQKFDLRFRFTKDEASDPWYVEPFFRLNEGEWTLFSVGPFTTSENNAFDFLGAKLVVIFDNGANSNAEVSFDNFFVVGPIQDFSEIFVDDDWADFEPGDVVQFPGRFNVQIIGQNAFDTIQEGINKIQVPEQAPISAISSANQLNLVDNGPSLATVHVAPGRYFENLQIYYPMIIEGGGSGEDEETNTIIDGDGSDVISIDGLASGFSEIDRLVLRNLRVTNGGSSGSGIFMTFLEQTQIANYKTSRTNSLNGISTADADFAHMTFENIAAVNNLNGIAFESGSVADIEVINCDLSNNENSGFRIASNVDSFDGLNMEGCTVNDNGINGLTTGPSGSQNVTNIHLSNCAFSGNGDALSQSGMGSGDISLFQFNGDAVLTNVSIHGDGAHIGLQIRGDDEGGLFRAGAVDLDSVIISGMYQHPSTWVGSGIYISGYSDVSTISFNDVEIDITPVPGSTPAINLNLENIFGNLDIGNTKLGGNASVDILNNSAAAVDAIDAEFIEADNNFEIEDRIVHAIDLEVIPGNVIQHKPKGSLLPQINLNIESAFGLVTWVVDNVFMTPNSFAEPLTFAPSIQRAINAASPGDTLNIAPGNTYSDAPNIYIYKDLVIIGSGPEQTVINSGGSTGTLELDPYWFEVFDTASVHIRDIAFDGGENWTYYAFQMDGTGSFTNVHFNNIVYDEYEGTAIRASGSGPVHVTNCTFTNIGRAGVWYSGSSVNGSLYKRSTYTGKGNGEEEEEYIDFAVVVDGGAHVTIDSSAVSNNYGNILGEEFSAGYLVRDGGTNVTIKNSEIGYSYHGIRLESGEGSPFVIITNNDIDGCEIGVEVESALYVRVQQNDITNNHTGVNLNNITTTFDVDLNTFLDNENYGVRVTNAPDGEIKDNIISGSTTGVEIQENAGATKIKRNEFCDNSSFAVRNVSSVVVDATNNWWGAPSGPGGAGPGIGDAVSEDVDFSQFKTSPLFPESPCIEGCIGDGDVEDDDEITPQDALNAFNISLGENTTIGEGSSCEMIASDVNCDGEVTPQDALDIFLRSLGDLPQPEECFAQDSSPLNKQSSAYLYSLSLIQITAENEQIKIAVVVDNAVGLDAFGLTFQYPVDKFEFVNIERAALTTAWAQLNARIYEGGKLIVGAFDMKPLAGTLPSELFHLVFKLKKEDVRLNEIQIVKLVADLKGALVNIPVSDPINLIPTAFSLHQNFPNPFNPETHIRFDIPKVSNDGVLVSLKIYNITGQLVRTLLNEKREAGVHTVTWDGKNDLGQPAASGTYFYTLIAGEFKSSQKMIMVK